MTLVLFRPTCLKTFVAMHVPLCYLQRYSQWPRCGNNLCPLMDDVVKTTRYVRTTDSDSAAKKCCHS